MRAAPGKCLIALGFLSLTIMLFANPPGAWQSHVPEKERVQVNPLENDPQAILAGEKMFRQHCASCHGKNAEGKGKKPNLRSNRVQDATPGELQWLLKNGSLMVGMPSWSRLPEQQRWQIVTYIKSLQSREIEPKSLSVH